MSGPLPVLHLIASADELEPFTLTNASLTQGYGLAIHVNRTDGSTDIYTYHRTSVHDETTVRAEVTTDPFGCGCP